MKTPKVINELNWTLGLGSRYAVIPLKYTSFEFSSKDFSKDVSKDASYDYSVFKAEAFFRIESIISDIERSSMKFNGFSDIPLRFRRLFLNEIYGEVVIELKNLYHELYEVDISRNTNLLSKLEDIIKVLETGEGDT